MGRNHTVRAQLRAATAEAHDRVDAVFSRFELTNGEDYARFLRAQGGALIALERALDEGIAPHLPIGWAARRRSAALLQDLAALGAPEPVADDLAPIERAEEALGTIYVLEGSRLGGALLKRSVGADLPVAFLAPSDPSLWRALLDTLESALETDAQRDAAIAAACRAFDHFERSGRAALPAVEAR